MEGVIQFGVAACALERPGEDRLAALIGDSGKPNTAHLDVIADPALVVAVVSERSPVRDPAITLSSRFGAGYTETQDQALSRGL